MGEIEHHIQRAWDEIRPTLDENALARRLARRRTPLLRGPPRAWCLAVRASDTRLPAGQSITLTRDRLAHLCAPVLIPAPGLMLDQLAPLLGTTRIGLRNARIDGTLRTRHIKLLAGRRGKPVPLLYTDQPLDPCSKGFANPDPAWIWTAAFRPGRIPRDITQTLTRIVRYISHAARHNARSHREITFPRAPSRCLPPPAPDLAWYKWSRSGHYLGNDPTNWRKGPHDPGDRPRYDRPKRRWSKRHAQSTSKGSLHFNGHQWICPRCHRTCRTIYLPLPRINLLTNLPPLAQINNIPAYADGFACHRCHRVKFFSRTRNDSWNQLIAYLTGGLLYGHEVPRPADFTKRKRPYRPRLGFPPPLRRRQVLKLLLKGHTRAQITASLRMSPGALSQHINKIYKSEHVRSQRALLEKHNLPLPPHLILKPNQILSRLRSGETIPTIATALHIRRASVERYIRDLRRAGDLPTRPTKRQSVAELHACGLTRHQIAEMLHTTPQSVSTRLSELRAARRIQ